ncbi:unnamed protein product [Dimorphilus gyrociliatus]|uniref:SOCS box domain-containing protein n=1 Tax=Dimorphilus gyrociliatus TaxID=2664684 RepID=A0A7I8VV89_9ANNE|nr:unnamed protein product [Dimorphilus gyrociliatus]
MLRVKSYAVAELEDASKKASINSVQRENVAFVGQYFCDPAMPPLHQAVASGNITLLKETLKRAKLDRLDQNGETALTLAVRLGWVDLLEVLVRGGAKSEGNNGKTALHVAVTLRSYQCIKRLLKLGIRADVSDASGYTPLMLASKNGDVSGVKLLIEHGGKIGRQGYLSSALPLALSAESIGCLRALLEAGAGVDCKVGTDPSRTLLVDAIETNNVKIVEILYEAFLAQGVCIGAALEKAIQLCLPKIMEIFLKRGYDPNRSTKAVPLLELALKASLNSRRELIRLLLLYGTNIKTIDKENSILFYQCPSVLSMLLHAGLNICNTTFQMHMIGNTDREKACKKVVKDWTSKPPSLSHFCRLKIRSQLRNVAFDVERLPLPPSIISYLQYDKFLMFV